MNELNGAVVMITGASGNVGAAVAAAFAGAGARLALVDLDADRLKQVVDSLPEGATARPFAADLSDLQAVDTLLVNIDEAFGKVDHVVHTVGGFAMGDPVHAGNLDVFDRMMMLNARLVYLLCGRVAAHMIEKNIAGSISIVLARAGKKGGNTNAAYSASKAAATRIMESMAVELKSHRIRVNGISPSIVDTPPNRDSMPNADPSAWVSPARIAELVLFLATNDAMTGADVEISAWS